MTALRWGSATDVGRVRDNNEDQLLLAEPLFAVADGMGGHAAGEVASQVAIEALRVAFGSLPQTSEGLAEAVEQANKAVWERAGSGNDLRGMGTTMTAVALVDDGDGVDRFAIANVGDSRAYLLRDGDLTQLTDDHSVAEEMVRSGQLQADQAALHPQRHMLTRVLGMDADVAVDIFALDVFKGDRILLASDGLSNEVTDAQIASTLRRLSDPDEACNELVQQARAHGGNDNITVVLVDVVDDDGKGRSAALTNDAPAAPAPPPAPDESRMLSAAERDARLRAMREEDLGDGDGPPARLESPSRRVTGRVVAFVVLLAVILLAATGVTAWYARASYFVGIDDGRVAIFKGRPGGVLFFSPTVEQRTDITEASLRPRVRQRLEDGRVESSLSDARAYVDRVRDAVEQDERDQQTTTTQPAPAPAPPAGEPATQPTTVP